VASIVGLFIAASGSDGNPYAIGMGLFVAGLAYAFLLIKQYFDRIDGIRR
jgi:hypothetical protein